MAGKKGLISESEANWGEFQCHKKAKAFKILHIEAFDRGDKYRLFDVHGNGGSIDVSSTWFFEHQPEIGGYIVKYRDGYLSYSPEKAFDDGYSEIFFETDGATATLKPNKISPALSDDVAIDKFNDRELVMIAALEKLSKLGNGDKKGNSDGNVIAIEALDSICFL